MDFCILSLLGEIFYQFEGPRLILMEPATLLKKRLWHWCFPVNFVKFLRTPFRIEHLWRLLLKNGHNSKSEKLIGETIRIWVSVSLWVRETNNLESVSSWVRETHDLESTRIWLATPFFTPVAFIEWSLVE